MIKLIRIILITLFGGLMFSAAFGQTGVIVGKITAKDTNESLPGANIVIEGTTIGVSSDINGEYELENAPVGEHTLTASFLGFKTVSEKITIKPGERITVNFVLGEDLMLLDDLVVIGYGTKRKRDITSSISKIDVTEIEEVPLTNIEVALQGKAAGVQVTQDNGMAGSPVTIRVRGTASVMTSSQPLYVVDGVPIITGSLTTESGYCDKSNALNLINPNDIASIEVLKDASAAAIYGARGANGVILITTKKGKQGKTKYNFSYNSGISKVTHILDVLDGQEYIRAAKQAWFNSDMGTEEEFYKKLPFGIYNNDLSYEENKNTIDNANTDWSETMLRTGFQQSANLSASGGTQNTVYYIGGSYNKTNGIIVGNDFQRVSGKINLEHTANKRLKFGANLGVTNRQYVNVPTGWAGGLGTAQSRSLPVMPIYNDDGTYFAPKSGTNVVADYEDRKYKAYTTSILGNLYANYQILSSLSFRTEFGMNNIYQLERKYEGTITREEANGTDRRLTVTNWNTNNTFNFNKTFKEKHNVTAMAGMSYQRYKQQGLELFGAGFPNPALENPTNVPNDRKSTNGWENEYAFLSFFGRMGYIYNNRYIATLSIRNDGSSRFGTDKKWGLFPAASVGWILTEENFMQNVPVITFLKLRGSYGITGNSEIPEYRYIGVYYITEYNGEAGIGIGRKENPNLHWEETAQFDIGIDFGLLDGRISGGFDYYKRVSTDVLLNRNIPATSGFTSVWDNIGKMENKGFEIFLTSHNFIGEFSWITDLNISRNQNKIINLEGQILSGGDAGGTFGNNYAQEGHPIGAWRLVEWAGVDPETGQDLFINQETGETTTEYNFERDAIVAGNPYPEFYGGINNTLKYKGFDFSFYFTFSYGNDIYRDDGKFFEGGNIGSNWNQMTTVLDAWQKPGDITDQSQLLWNSSVSTYNTTKYLDDGSYLRLKSLTFGYTFPEELTRKLKFDRIRIYFVATNIWTLTNYIGWDPEVNRDNSANVTQGVTYLSPPQAKTYNIGINLNF